MVFLVVFVTTSTVTTFLFEYGHNEAFDDLKSTLWWQIITFSTTGYGDMVPQTTGGRIATVFTIMLGLGVVSFLSGTMASVFVDRKSRLKGGLVDFPKIKGHFVVCGWKINLTALLKEILLFNQDMSADQIVLVSNADPDRVAEIKEDPALRDLKYVRGDYYAESTLNRASVKQSKKVIILADRLESASIAEVDSKTVMTVLAIKAMSRDIFVCAEVLDKKYVNYLKQAMCDEIILVRDYAQRMLANASALDGISHVLYDMISPEGSDARLSTIDIPREFILGEYGKFRQSLDQTKNILIGVLENTGSSQKMKLDALREAQKTPDVSKLVTNLQHVKSMEPNCPVIFPKEDYIIAKHSKAIVLEKRV